MRLQWDKSTFGAKNSMTNGDNHGSYIRLGRGYWTANLYTNGSRVKIDYATNEREIRRIVRQWVSIPF